MAIRLNKESVRKALRKRRVRAKVHGVAVRPRLSVFRGITQCYVQLIDDVRGVTLASATERELGKDVKGTKTDRAKALGALIGDKAAKAGITAVVFDRGGKKYHGRVQAIAEGAREKGLQF